MAVSRGGGFSGGGGRSFSSHGRSGGSSGPSFSTRPFAGATAYFYISHTGRRCQFYSATPPKRQSKISAVLLAILALVILIAFMSLAFFACIPTRLSAGACTPTGVYLNDKADLVENETQFNKSMKAFYEKTGVEPYLYTISEDDFPSVVYGELDAYALQSFAYDEYYNICSDEGHYLITMVKLNDGEYLWCEMAGDDSVGLIDDDAFGGFQVNMLALTAECNVGEVVADCMENLSSDVFVITAGDKFAMIMLGVASLAVLAVIIISLVSTLKKITMINGYFDYTAKNGTGHSEKAEAEFRNF